METNGMQAVFTANIRANIGQLAELFKAYDLAELGYKMQEEQSKQCYTEALQAGEYHAAEGYNMRGVNINEGDRVTDEEYSWLLSNEDFS